MEDESKKVYQILKDRILDGSISKGEALPSIESVAKSFNLEQEDVRLLYNLFEKEGLIKKTGKTINPDVNRELEKIEKDIVQIIKVSKSEKFSVEDLEKLIEYIEQKILN
ncbi:MAG: GntR family transcriptional regulator [bacterium]